MKGVIKISDKKRIYFVDWLRILAVFLLIPFHSAIAYVQGPVCYVKSAVTSVDMMIISSYIGMWFMPLLFFISGISTLYSLQIRSSATFIRERLLKLMLPLGVGIITIVPILSYYRARQHGFLGSFFSFYPKFFTSGIYPNGYYEWAHFWFLPYLFVYAIITLPLFTVWMNKEFCFIDRLILKSKGWIIYSPVLVFMFIEAVFRVNWPGLQNLYNDWANFWFYLALYIIGFIYSRNESLAKAIKDKFIFSLSIAVTTTVAIFLIDLSKAHIIWSYNVKAIFYLMLHGINTWFWVLGFIGFGSRWLNFTNKFQKYANDACFPYFVLHYLPVTIIGYYIVNQNLSVIMRFSIVNILSIITTLVLYQFLFKKNNFIRVLFGLKPILTENKALNKGA
jgi:glucans biosynthesis protein C